MKILGLYINNYGKFKDFTYSFNNDLNIIFEENGYGKTTITEFICAMLFGYSGNKKSVDENPRIKYAPWNGGNYGGTLTIEVNNIKYKIERYFHPSKTNEDTFKVINLNNNKETSLYSSNIGEEILNISKDSFKRSILIPQSEISLSFGSDISDRLLNLIGGTKKGFDKKSAIEKLDNKIKEYKGINGSIKSYQDRIKLLTEEIIDMKNSTVGANEINNEIINIDKEISSIKDEKKKILDSISSYNSNYSKLKDYNEYKSKIEDKKKLEEEINKINIGTLEEIKEIYNDINIYNQNEEKLKKYNNISNGININDLNKVENIINNSIKKNNPIYYILLGILLVFGIGIMFLNLIIGIIICLLSVVVFILLLNNNSKKIRYKEDDEKFIIKFFSDNDIFSRDYKASLNIIKERYNTLAILNNDMDLNKIKEENLRLKFKLDNLFIKYFKEEISYLEGYEILQKRSEEKTRLIIKMDYLDNEINLLLNKHDYSTLDENLKNDINELYSKSNELDKKINELISTSSSKKTVIENLNNNSILLEDKINLCEDLKEQKLTLEKEKKLLELTKEIINDSHKSLLERYLNPMKTSINYYLSKILDYELSFVVDVDFDLYIIENDSNKDISYYSKGYKQLISLCMRLALIDCLYKDEKPFIILDDPFVDYDDPKLELVKKLIKEISHKYQVIYFTCHNSRLL